MKPSEKMRKFALKVNSGKFQATCWIVAGITMAIIGIIMLFCFGITKEIPFTSKQIENGIEFFNMFLQSVQKNIDKIKL